MDMTWAFILQGLERGEASECGDASLHGAGGDLLEHPHVPLAEDLYVSSMF